MRFFVSISRLQGVVEQDATRIESFQTSAIKTAAFLLKVPPGDAVLQSHHCGFCRKQVRYVVSDSFKVIGLNRVTLDPRSRSRGEVVGKVWGRCGEGVGNVGALPLPSSHVCQ
jgi:hypothetical protein